MRVRRADANQPEIVAYLRGLGYHVAHTHTIGHGFPDLLVSKKVKGIPWSALLEVKAPGGKLTKDEQEFAEEYRGKLIVCYGPEDCAEKLLQEANNHWILNRVLVQAEIREEGLTT